jgi:hypothetical protein
MTAMLTASLCCFCIFPAALLFPDTPGVHLHHRVPHMLAPDELKLLHPRRRLAPFSPPSPLDIMMEGQEEGEGQGDEDSQWKDRVRGAMLNRGCVW